MQLLTKSRRCGFRGVCGHRRGVQCTRDMFLMPVLMLQLKKKLKSIQMAPSYGLFVAPFYTPPTAPTADKSITVVKMH